jgi:hypothetical protein
LALRAERVCPEQTASRSKLECGQRSEVNAPTAVRLGLRIHPMMLRVDFAALGYTAHSAHFFGGGRQEESF